ncbi:uncharacterized protein LOC141818657 [Curcuma longa]|uniref:uncharacterized protein LOC141818657 n=1 Tax=Curcuma longa TaxID=136217 RepID=UPI003D9F110F
MALPLLRRPRGQKPGLRQNPWDLLDQEASNRTPVESVVGLSCSWRTQAEILGAQRDFFEDGSGVGAAEIGGRSGAYGCCDKIRQRGGRKKIDGRADHRGSLGDGFHELEKKMQGLKLRRSQSRGISRKLSPKC